MHEFADQLLKTIRKQELMRAGERIAAAVSGGADSVAMLWLLLELRPELGIVLSVAHVNHKLRGEESDADERFVAELAQRHGLELHSCVAPLDSNCSALSSARKTGIEASARSLRYRFFRRLAREGRITKIATAHTLDDQAETVLLRIFRGTGIRGLAGIHPRIRFNEQGQTFGEVVRPLLSFRRAALHGFLRERDLRWREDSSNRDIAFLRNRLRHRLLPMIAQDFGEAAIEHLGDLAEIARAEEDHWEHWKQGHDEISAMTDSGAVMRGIASLPVRSLLDLPLAAQRRLVRAWVEANAPDSGISFRLIEEVLELARGLRGQKKELPGGWNIRRRRHELLLESESARARGGVSDYEYALSIPGAVEVPELGSCVEARTFSVEEVSEDSRCQLLSLERAPKEVVIRNWRAGDRYWPAHTASAKKVKDLLTGVHATGAEKKMWPVAVAGGSGLVWMRGFPVPEAFRSPPGAPQAIWIRELPA